MGLASAARIRALRIIPFGRAGVAKAVWQRLGRVLGAERDRWVLWSPVGFGLGIGIYFSLRFEPVAWVGPVVMTAILVVVLLPGCRGPGVALSAGTVAVVAAGFAVAQVRTTMVDTPLLERRLGPVDISGRIEHFEPRVGSVRVLLTDLSIDRLTHERTPRRVRISLRGPQPRMQAGDLVRLRGVLMPLPAPSAPGGFDFQRQSYFQRLGAVGYGYGRAAVVGEVAGAEGTAAVIARLRQRITERVQDHLKGSTGAIAVALMTGERGEIPKAVMVSIRESGLAHLLAISGLHMGLMAGVLFTASRAGLALIPVIALRFPIKKFAAAIAIAGAAAYAALSGANIPTQRALLMVGLVMLAFMLDRHGVSMRGVAGAAIIILCLAPESLLTASFQLSFAAVVALIAVYEAVRDMHRRRGQGPASGTARVVLYLGSVALTTLVAGAATAPFAAYHFNQYTSYSLAANLVAVPITTLWIMPWAVAAFVLMPFGLENMALTPMGWGIELVIAVAAAVSQWPGAVSRLPTMPGWSIIFVTIGGLWLCLWRTSWRYLGAVVIAAGLGGILFVRPPDLLINAEGSLIAVRTQHGVLKFSTLRGDRFARESWLRRYAYEEDRAPWPKEGHSADGTLGCDSLGCIVRIKNQVVAVTRRPEALAEDCRHADIMLSLVPVRIACPTPHTLIDRRTLARQGAHAIWLGNSKRSHPSADELAIVVKSVNALRGERPWSVGTRP